MIVMDFSPVNRPATLRDLAIAFRVPYPRLDRLVSRHSIDPAFRAAGTRFYGRSQVRAIYTALQETSGQTVPARGGN